MFCGAFTTRMKPKLTTNCSSMVIPTMLMPGVATPCSAAMTIGIMADASAVALAKPRWIKVRNRLSTARTNSAAASLRPNWTTARSASHEAPLVCSNAVPTLMPIPNSTIVPQGILGCASFQFMIPMPGKNISATAGNFLHFRRHHPCHHEVKRDRHQNAEWRRGDEPFKPSDGRLQGLFDDADRDHVLRGGGLDADVPDAGGLHRGDHQHAGKGASFADAESGDDAERDRHQAGDARRGRGHQKRHHEADQNGTHDHMVNLGADTREDRKRDALVEPGRGHGGG